MTTIVQMIGTAKNAGVDMLPGTQQSMPDNVAQALINCGLASLVSPFPYLPAQSVEITKFSPQVLGGAPNAAEDTASILGAAMAAFNAGGGVVQLPATTIYLSSPLPMYSGVTYNGAGWQLFPSSGSGTGTIPDGQGMVVTSGTHLIAATTGAYDAFDWNNVDSGSAYTNSKLASLAMLTNAGISNLAIEGFAYGVKIGAKNTAGTLFGLFENLIAINCTQWGFWFENCLHTNYRRISSYYNAVGQSMFTASGGNIAVTNCQYKDILGVKNGALGVAQNLQRGVVFGARNGAFNNGCRIENLQCNAFNTTVVAQAVTFTNASQNITVTDGTKFAVGMPITFSAGAAFTTPPISSKTTSNSI